jgi:hypothetical protein
MLPFINRGAISGIRKPPLITTNYLIREHVVRGCAIDHGGGCYKDIEDESMDYFVHDRLFAEIERQ